jgi:hypothetical protein
LCRDKNREDWRGGQRGNEVPRRRCGPWPSHDARVSHAETHRGSPKWSRPLALEPVAAGAMKLRVRVGGVDQHISEH